MLVGRSLRLGPGLVEVRDEQHHPLNLTVDVGPPLGSTVELRAILGDHAFEVAHDLVGRY